MEPKAHCWFRSRPKGYIRAPTNGTVPFGKGLVETLSCMYLLWPGIFVACSDGMARPCWTYMVLRAFDLWSSQQYLLGMQRGDKYWRGEEGKGEKVTCPPTPPGPVPKLMFLCHSFQILIKRETRLSIYVYSCMHTQNQAWKHSLMNFIQSVPAGTRLDCNWTSHILHWIASSRTTQIKQI